MRAADWSDGWRHDIQILRGLAVGLIVLEHARPGVLPGGFLGVDMFFVVSGFLMTRLVVDRLDSGTFSFREFYARRARRLLPAAYATILVVLAAAPLLIDPFELRQLFFQAAGAFAFASNIVLWAQTDYFGSGAALKPLLHMWSLSVEEQFFFILPAALVLSAARWRVAAVAAAVTASAALCFLFVQRSPSATFYFLPFRAWELGLGTIAALLMRSGAKLPPWRVLRWAAAMVLVGVPCLAGPAGHPGLPALAICIATMAILLQGDLSAPSPALAPLRYLGDRSYSLYLVHWPVFAFANNVWLTAPPMWVVLALLPLCLVWAEAQYRWIEQPFRRAPVTRRAALAYAAIPVAALSLAFALMVRPAGTPEIARREANIGLGHACMQREAYAPDPSCDSAPRPSVLLWGDSFAMHLADGLASLPGLGVRQATKVACGPFLGVAPLDGARYTRRWAEGCLRFNDAVLAHLRDTPTISTVVLASAFVHYLPADDGAERSVLLRGPEGLPVERPTEVALLLDVMRRTIREIRALGRTVVVMGPPPSIRADTARCLSRLEAGLASIGGAPGCEIPTASFRAERAGLIALLDALEQDGSRLIRPDRFLCGPESCRVRVDGLPLYQDATHLSREGSKALARSMEWSLLGR